MLLILQQTIFYQEANSKTPSGVEEKKNAIQMWSTTAAGESISTTHKARSRLHSIFVCAPRRSNKISFVVDVYGNVLCRD